MRNLISIFTILVFAASFVSCEKDPEIIPDNQKFVGKYFGSAECDIVEGFDATLEINEVENSVSAVIAIITILNKSNEFVYEGNIKGSNIELKERNGNSQIIGTGTLFRNSLTLTITYGFDIGIATCNYTFTM